jgi:hypothetical protein
VYPETRLKPKTRPGQYLGLPGILLFLLVQGFTLYGQNQAAPAKAPPVQRLTQVVSLQDLRRGHRAGQDTGYFAQDSLVHTPSVPVHFDETDTLTGFVVHTGYVGKPYQQWLYGLNERYFRPDRQWQHPLTGQSNVYFAHIDAALPAFDTRTPYFLIDFDQTAGNAQLLRTLVSQNLNPFTNVSVTYRSRNAEGVYTGQNLRQIYFGSRLHYLSFNQRLWLTACFLHHEYTDGMQGVQTSGTANPLAATFYFPAGVNLTRRSLQWKAEGRYRLVQTPANRLELWGSIQADNYTQWYDDRVWKPGYSRARGVDSLPDFPYRRWLIPDSLAYSELYFIQTLTGAVGGLYRLKVGAFTLHNRLGVLYERSTFSQTLTASERLAQTLFLENTLSLNTATSRLSIQSDLQQLTSNLQNPAFRWQVTALWQPVVKVVNRWDSSALDTNVRRFKRLFRKPYLFRVAYVPFTLRGTLLTGSMNPTLFDQFHTTLTFVGTPELVNERLLHIRGSAEWVSRPKVHKALPYLPHTLRVEAFSTQLFGGIGYTSGFEATQARAGDVLNSLGLTLTARTRWRRYYLELDGTVLTRQTTTPVLEAYTTQVPTLYGSARLFWQGRIPRTPLILEAGLAARAYSPYQGFAFEVSTQQFYPANNPSTLPAYVRLNPYVSARIYTATVYFKVQNATGGLLAPTYETVPGYPMLPRAFCWGFSWVFYN